PRYYETGSTSRRNSLRLLQQKWGGKELISVTLTGLISEQWKELGWQGANPSTDIRGSGFLSLENLLFFAKTFSLSWNNISRLLFGATF
ncbi:ELMO/CED-12 family protein, partial [Tanacetum coccineum]